MKKEKHKKIRGFSMGEVVLSVFILGVVMLPILTLFVNGTRNFQDERDSVIAAMLAQEGIELVRNMRDNNWADRSSNSLDEPFTFDDIDSGSNCKVDYDDTGEISCLESAPSVLSLDSDGFYAHDAGGKATKFKRGIKITKIDNNNYELESRVLWGAGAVPTNCTVENKCVFSKIVLTSWGTGT